MGNLSIPAVGFAGGIERLMMLSNKLFTKNRPVLVLPISNAEHLKALEIVDILRQSGISSYLDFGKKIGDVIQKAINKYNTRYVVILGSKEIENGVCTLKDLDSSSQETLKLGEIITVMCSQI
jgi:histidyl-tRNA synthetase